MRARIPIDQKNLSDFCRRNHIRRLALFGSVLRDDFGPDSDIDVLVEFEVGHVPGLAFLRLEQDLSKLLGGRRIDLVTPSFLNPRIRDRVVGDAEVQYVQGMMRCMSVTCWIPRARRSRKSIVRVAQPSTRTRTCGLPSPT